MEDEETKEDGNVAEVEEMNDEDRDQNENGEVDENNVAIDSADLPKDGKTAEEDENDTSKNQYYINLNAWSLEELHVPLYPEKRVLKAIESKLKIRYGGESFNIRYY